MARSFQIEDVENWYKCVFAGEQIFLDGVIYTARDAAHKRILSAIHSGAPLPFPLAHTAIYYAGPTPAKNGYPIGSCGPTTSCRMDPYMETLTALGLRCTIGKGDRAPEVYRALQQHGGVYLCAIGGAGALAAQSVTDMQVIAYEDLGCESVKKLTVRHFPLFVGIDAEGHSIFGGHPS